MPLPRLAAAAIGTCAAQVVGTLYAASSVSPTGDASDLTVTTTNAPLETADALDETKNVLFLFADDFRPQLSFWDNRYSSGTGPWMHTPNLEKLAGESFVATNMQVQTAWCCPSRSSSLTSRRPATTRVYKFEYFREEGLREDVLTTPGYFKGKGYTTVGMGKIFHPITDTEGDAVSWSEPFYEPESYDYWQDGLSWHAATAEELAEHPHPDNEVKEYAIQKLKNYADSGENFFLGVGFFKPHLPMVFPEEYGDYYADQSAWPMTADEQEANLKWVPEDAPYIAYDFYPELKGFNDVQSLVPRGAYNTTVPDWKAAELRKAYFSCVSHTDAMIGEVLDALDELGLADNTVVTFQGDHGWQLGEHATWEKQTNYHIATNTPLIVRVPGVTDGGILDESLLEAIDVFPTLVELAGFEAVDHCPEDWEESQQVQLCTEGQSFVPLIEDPDLEWKQAVFTQFHRREWFDDDDNDYMGFSVQTKDYHYVHWCKFDYDLNAVDWDFVHSVELYDHTVDPNENHNIAGKIEAAEIVAAHLDLLKGGYTAQRVELEQ